MTASRTPRRARSRAALQQVIAANRNHPGALHYWVHLWESTHPERAEAEADRLASADAGRRPHRPHAGAHLHAPRPLRRCRLVEREGRQGRRRLHRAVQGAGPLSARLLPTQHSLHLDGRERGGPQSSGPRVRAQGRVGHPRGCAERRSRPPGLRRRSVLGDGAVRAVVGDPRGQGADLSVALHPRRVDVRAGHGAQRDRTARGRREGARRAESDPRRSWRSISPSPRR